MIGQNITGYGSASMSWPRIGMRNAARESAPAQAAETASPNAAARSVVGETDAAPVARFTRTSARSAGGYTYPGA